MFSIHAPREGSGRYRGELAVFYAIFYPRSPGGERQSYHTPTHKYTQFSIHAPREGSGGMFSHSRPRISESFLSTLPGRGAATAISVPATALTFLSTLPGRGAAMQDGILHKHGAIFLSTLPGRGAAAALGV